MKHKQNEKGFSAFEGVIILIIVVIVVAAGMSVLKHQNKKTANTPPSHTPTKNENNTNSSSKTNPYAGWKVGDVGGMVSFYYPAEWTAQTNSDSSEQITDLAPLSGWRVQLIVSNADLQGLDAGWPTTEPVTVMGQKAYLAFGSAKNSSGAVEDVRLSLSPTKSGNHCIKLAKYPGKYFCMVTIFNEMNNGVAAPIMVDQAKGNANYAQLKLLLESVAEK